jgi:hypothetical protein
MATIREIMEATTLKVGTGNIFQEYKQFRLGISGAIGEAAAKALRAQNFNLESVMADAFVLRGAGPGQGSTLRVSWWIDLKELTVEFDIAASGGVAWKAEQSAVAAHATPERIGQAVADEVAKHNKE